MLLPGWDNLRMSTTNKKGLANNLRYQRMYIKKEQVSRYQDYSFIIMGQREPFLSKNAKKLKDCWFATQ